MLHMSSESTPAREIHLYLPRDISRHRFNFRQHGEAFESERPACRSVYKNLSQWSWRKRCKSARKEPALMRETAPISERLPRFSQTLMNAKSGKPDTFMVDGLRQRTAVNAALGEEQTVQEDADALKAMAHSRALGPDDISAKHRKTSASARGPAR